MMATKYAHILQRVIETIEGFRAGSVPIDNLQAVLSSAADTVSLPEEQALSDMLRKAEGKIEMARFMSEPASMSVKIEAVLQIVTTGVEAAMLP